MTLLRCYESLEHKTYDPCYFSYDFSVSVIVTGFLIFRLSYSYSYFDDSGVRA